MKSMHFPGAHGGDWAGGGANCGRGVNLDLAAHAGEMGEALKHTFLLGVSQMRDLAASGASGLCGGSGVLKRYDAAISNGDRQRRVFNDLDFRTSAQREQNDQP